MQKLEEFKDFVRQNLYLKTAVDKRMITWQKAYEIYDLFGPDAKDFQDLKAALETPPQISAASDTQQASPNAVNTTTDLLGLLASLDYNKIGTTIDQLQRILSVVKDLARPEETPPTKGKRVFKRFND